MTSDATEPDRYRFLADSLPGMPQTPVRDVSIAYETHGDPSSPAVLLIAGLGNQLISWPTDMVTDLADRGHFVIRFDNRDTGLSSGFEDWGEVDARKSLVSALTGRRPEVPYDLADMAGDAVGLLDHLGVERSHVVGASMGGMIAQRLAIDHGDRVLSLVSIMSTTGNPAVGVPTPEAAGLLLQEPATTRAHAIAASVAAMRIISGRYFDEPRAVTRATQAHDRAFRPGGVGRQFGAIVSDGDRTAELGGVSVPTLVIHGAADPLIHRSGGEATAAAIPEADLMILEGMGHDIPPQLWHVVRDRMLEHFAGATT